MTKLLSFIALAFVMTTGCSYENKTVEENCSMNGRAVDCREMESGRRPVETPIPVPSKPTRFACGQTMCDSVTEFCFAFENWSGTELSASCQSQDLNCSTCECIEQRVRPLYPKECGTARICRSTGGQQYKFTCRLPSPFARGNR